MKDAHLFAALEAAVQRFGTSALPDDPSAVASRPQRSVRRGRRRSQGWVSIREIEACQPPNTYPRFGRRLIKVRCAQLAREEEGPVLEVRLSGLRTWVRFAQRPEGRAAVDGASGEAVPPDGPHDAATDAVAPSALGDAAEAGAHGTAQGGVA